MTDGQVIALLVVAIIAGAAGVGWINSRNRLRRAEFIRTFRLPPGLLGKVSERYPHLELKDAALVSRGLRQFFIAYLMNGKRFVSMPSQVADELWHEFILYTREYQDFCDKAFGSFLHHTPAAVLSSDRKRNEGLRRVWWYCCKYENIHPVNPTRLPLLFALDAKLKILSGHVYYLTRDGKGERPWATEHYVGDFSSTSFDGGTDGLGDGGGNGGGGGDGGGCGGGD